MSLADAVLCDPAMEVRIYVFTLSRFVIAEVDPLSDGDADSNYITLHVLACY